MSEALLFDIQHGSFVDGPGIRTTVFFKGCNLSCLWCHNPEGISPLPQMLFYQDRCVGCGLCRKVCQNKSCVLCGTCADLCPAEARRVVGKKYDVASLMEILCQDLSFYRHSQGGVTFSGGECMLQVDFLCEILQKCKERGIHTAVDTAGHVPYEHFERILPLTDLFLYDVKLLDAEKHKKYVGVNNALILQNLARLLADGAKVQVRIPVIPTVNATVEEMEAIHAFLQTLPPVEKVELLPYHAMGESKQTALGRETCVFPQADAQTLQTLQGIFSSEKAES